MKNDDIFESKEFKEACEETCEKIAAEYPNEGQRPHVFSDDFEKKMAELLKAPPRRKFRIFNTVGKKVAVIVIVLTLALTTTVFGVKALRIPVIEFIVKVYEEFTSLFVDNDQADYGDDFQFEPKAPTYIPEGVEVGDEYKTDAMYQLEYISQDDTIYYYKQNVLYQNQKIDNEEYNEFIEIDNKKYYYYITASGNKLIWYDDYYSYMLSGNINKEIMLKIAQSVE